MIKDIVVNLSIRDARDPARDFAISTAAAFNADPAGAHLAGMALLYEPLMPPMVDMYGIPPEVIESQRIENEQAGKSRRRQVSTKSARRAGLKRPTPACLDAAVASAPGLFAQVARRFDLSVVGQPEPDTPVLDRLIVEAALFESWVGRCWSSPTFKEPVCALDHVMLCWDGSRSAARAAGDAMPFIRRSKLVEVVIVGSEAAKSDEIARRRHRQPSCAPWREGGAQAHRYAPRPMSPASFFRTPQTCSADFMIMGGYGHSRLREFILGGVTRGILASMTLPTLMSH